jgi:hypothetical protein
MSVAGKATRWLGYILGGIGLIASMATLFFGYYGVFLVYESLTFHGEGSLGHVGMYIAAGLFPLLALLFGGIAWISISASRRRLGF